MISTGQVVWGMLITPLVVHIISRKARTSCRPLFYALIAASLCVLIPVYLGFAGGISFKSANSNLMALAAFYAAYCLVTSSFFAIQDLTPRVVMLVLFGIPLFLLLLVSPIIGVNIKGNQIIYSKNYENNIRCVIRRSDYYRDGSSHYYEANIYKSLRHVSFLEESVSLVPPVHGSQSKSEAMACNAAIARIKVPHAYR